MYNFEQSQKENTANESTVCNKNFPTETIEANPSLSVVEDHSSEISTMSSDSPRQNQNDSPFPSEPDDLFNCQTECGDQEDTSENSEKSDEKDTPPSSDQTDNNNSSENIIPDFTDTEKKNTKKTNNSGISNFIFDAFELIAVSLALVMIILTVFVRHSPVNGSSMYPTILGRNEAGFVNETVGEDVLLISNLLYTPKRGDIVVIQSPTLYTSAKQSMNHAIVKRIIAVGGDTMTIDFANWSIEINGEMFEEGFGKTEYVNYEGELSKGKPSLNMNGFSDINVLTRTEGCTVKKISENKYTVVIPEGMIFVMGDNRRNSRDSRTIGLIDERWIVGRSILRIYPFDRIGSTD